MAAYLQTYGAIVVDVKYSENLLEVLLRTPVGHDIQNNHEFPEVNMTVLQGEISYVVQPDPISEISIIFIGKRVLIPFN